MFRALYIHILSLVAGAKIDCGDRGERVLRMHGAVNKNEVHFCDAGGKSPMAGMHPWHVGYLFTQSHLFYFTKKLILSCVCLH